VTIKTSKTTGLSVDWSTDAIVARRERYYAASQRAFVPFKKPMIFERGEGQYLWDEQGNRMTDLLGMNLCISVGHAHPMVNAAAREQAMDLQHCTTMFYHPVPAHLAEELVATMPAGEEWVVHFTNSGAEAVDLALMMARAHTGNHDFLALWNAYHGPTYGAQSLTGIQSFRYDVGLLGGIHFVAEPNQYRGAFGEGTDAYLDDIDNTISYATTGKLAGMIIEPVQGYGGIIAMPDGYMKGAFERVRAAGGLCVIDEVQSGFGRTGDNFWAFEEHDVVPDMMIIAKGIGNGYPLGAVVAKKSVAEAMDGKFVFHTYGSNPISCAAGRAVLKTIREEKLQENAKSVGAELLDGLKQLQKKYPVIGDVRGKGLMTAVELVKDQRTKEPDPEAAAAVFEVTRDHGIIVSKSGTFKNVLRLVPPLCLSHNDIDHVVTAFDKCFASL
jgi:alanine-glyoxylate transaminase/(R)-3-amino-2-methylpropionate-pyruvate transaminase